MTKEFEEILRSDFKIMRSMLNDIEKHLLTQEFEHAFKFYNPLRNIIYEATVDIFEHKRGLQDIGDAMLDITMDEE